MDCTFLGSGDLPSELQLCPRRIHLQGGIVAWKHLVSICSFSLSIGSSRNVSHVLQLISCRWPYHPQFQWLLGCCGIFYLVSFERHQRQQLFPLEAMSIGIFKCLLTCRLEALNPCEVWPSSNLSSCLLWRIPYIHGIFLLVHPQTWNSKAHVAMLHLDLLGLNRFVASSLFDDGECENSHCPWKTSFSTIMKEFIHLVEHSTFSNTPCLTRLLTFWWKSSCRWIGTFPGWMSCRNMIFL